MMQITETIWFNGDFVPWHDAKVHVLSHTLHYGGGAFEGIRFYKTEQGPAIFRLADHMERLFYSASILKMDLSYDKAALTEIILELVRRNGLEEGYIRPLLFYGYGKMGVNPAGNPSGITIACWPWGAYLPHQEVDIKISRYTRIHPNSTHVSAKICGHYVNSILASLEIQGTHYHEALLLDNEGYIAEGVGENFFMFKDGQLYTPQLGNILPGITRDTVIKLAHTLGISVTETRLTVEQAYQADEAFFTGTAAEIAPIRSINDQVLGTGSVGTLTRRIKAAYLDVVRGKRQDFNAYLTYLA